MSVTFDQCHGISATILFSELKDPRSIVKIDLTFCSKINCNAGANIDLTFVDLVESENQLEMLSVWSCRCQIFAASSLFLPVFFICELFLKAPFTM